MSIVRRYKEEDFDAVNEILQESFSCCKMRNIKDDSHIELVAVEGDQVIGYLVLTKILNIISEKYYFLIDYVCVKSEFQNRKIGYLLMTEAEKVARNEKASYLQLTSSKFRIAAHKLYKNCGFEVRDSNIFRKVL